MINSTVKRTMIIAGLIACAVLAFVIRLSPLTYFAGSGDMLGAPDSWYNLRLVENMLQNGEMMNFDPMTAYDDGVVVNWGILFTAISSLLAVIGGAVTRVEIIDAVSWLPPIMASLCVVVMFFVGKKFGDWKTGLVTALFMAVIGGQYFLRSVYGLFDHHVAEVLFSCLFCLCYVLALHYSQKADFKSPKTLKLPILFGVLSGLAYLAGLLTMTTLVVFGLFLMIFTLIQFIANYHKGKSSDYLVVINTITFLIGCVGLLIYGIKVPNFDLVSYSTGLVIVQILPIISTWILYGLTKVKQFKSTKWHPTIIYVGVIAGICALSCLICAFVNYDLLEMVIYNVIHQFTPAVGGQTTVQEASAWSLNSAWSSFGLGLLLCVLGFGMICYRAIKKEDVICHFFVWWSVGIFILACAQVRWEYYFAPVVALLSGIFVAWSIDFLIKEISKTKSYFVAKRAQKNSKKKKTPLKQPNTFYMVLMCCILLFGGLFVGLSISNDVYLAESYGQGGGTSSDWVDACEWLKENTPSTGIEPYEHYDKDGFEYPDESYGVISWWDFGHYITVIGERLPVANPFQMGIDRVAGVLMETNETKTCELMDEYGAKYIMVDYNTGNNFIPVMAVWLDKTLTSQKDTYNTMAFRLYNLEGRGNEDYGIPALEHFKLVYTSPKTKYGYATNGQIVEQTTKIFEYV